MRSWQGERTLSSKMRILQVSPFQCVVNDIIGSGVPGASATGAQSKNPVESAVILVLKNAARRSTGFFDYVAPTFPPPLRSE